MCDLTVCVLAPMQVRIRRLMARDAKSEEAIRARIHAQPDDSFYLSHADVVIRTDDTTDTAQLTQAVQDCLARVGVLS
jgi:dephospho-CoA kinase